jgi:methionyl-tRNA formyltransferase
MQQGAVPQIPQDPDRATYAKKIGKAEGHIDWTRPAATVHNQIRAMTPHPGAFFFWKSTPDKPAMRIIVQPGRVGGPLPAGVRPGQILGLTDDSLGVACADAVYLIPTVIPAGKRAMDARAFSCGYLGKCDDTGLTMCAPEEPLGT